MNVKAECLKATILSESDIQKVCDATYVKNDSSGRMIRYILLSHERLRAELAGAESLLREKGIWISDEP